MAPTLYVFLSFLILLLCLPSSQGQGYSFSNCLTDSDCVGDRSCRQTTFDLSLSCQDNGNYCICVPADIKDFSCFNSSDCDQGETCTDLLSTLTGGAVFESGLCTDNSQLPFLENPQPCENNLDCSSSNACITIPPFSYCGASRIAMTEQPSTTDSPVAVNPMPMESEQSDQEQPQEETFPESSTEGGDACISSKALSHLPKASLRYAMHRKAVVLCDMNRSCATPGHLVTYHGQVMMMDSYCRIVNCSKDVMDVNSPRYERGLRIRSSTRNLEFLGFAARYGTRAEEKIFETAVWLGL